MGQANERSTEPKLTVNQEANRTAEPREDGTSLLLFVFYRKTRITSFIIGCGTNNQLNCTKIRQKIRITR